MLSVFSAPVPCRERLVWDVQAPADVVPGARGPDGMQGPWGGVPPPRAAGQGWGAELQGTIWPRPGGEEGTRTWPFVIQVPNKTKNDKTKRDMVNMTTTLLPKCSPAGDFTHKIRGQKLWESILNIILSSNTLLQKTNKQASRKITENCFL